MIIDKARGKANHADGASKQMALSCLKSRELRNERGHTS